MLLCKKTKGGVIFLNILLKQIAVTFLRKNVAEWKHTLLIKVTKQLRYRLPLEQNKFHYAEKENDFNFTQCHNFGYSTSQCEKETQWT